MSTDIVSADVMYVYVCVMRGQMHYHRRFQQKSLSSKWKHRDRIFDGDIGPNYVRFLRSLLIWLLSIFMLQTNGKLQLELHNF